MKIVSVAFIAPIMRLFNYHENTIIQNQHMDSLSNSTSKQIFAREKRRISMMVNKYKNLNDYNCFFCLGTGYVKCDACSRPYCQKCDYTGLKQCHICGGSGKGGPRYGFVTISDTIKLNQVCN